MTLSDARKEYNPELPVSLQNLEKSFFKDEVTPSVDKEIARDFPKTSGKPVLRMAQGEPVSQKPLRVGVVFSGGQASGGHNVIAGLYDSLKKLHTDSQLIGFLGGPRGIIRNEAKNLSAEDIAPYRNQGGFDLIGSGRDKIEKEEDFKSTLKTVQENKLDGLVIIGGDDSNTNAAMLAEYIPECTIVGVPKTIDGDLTNDYVEKSFGFDTATKTYANTIGSIARDALSAGKYYFFIKLMGRSASHIALECAMQTHPNITLISEEKRTLKETVDEIVETIEERKKLGKNYGVILIPEGIIESMPDVKAEDLGTLDPHGNIEVSKIESERLLIELVKKRVKISAQPLFLGYEGRSCFPSNFDSTYCYSLGFVATALVASKKTSYMAAIQNLSMPTAKWEVYAVPLPSLMHYEMRKGKKKPVIQKTLVDLHSSKFQEFVESREKWKFEDDYKYPGPIQFSY